MLFRSNSPCIGEPIWLRNTNATSWKSISNAPVILTDYPKEIKAFYMKQNEDGKTVRAMDVLFPKIGEIIGGSEREADYDKLLQRIEELHIPMKDMWWYLDDWLSGSNV